MQIALTETQVGVLKKALYQVEDAWLDAQADLMKSTVEETNKEDQSAVVQIERDLTVLRSVMILLNHLPEEPNLPNDIGEMFPKT